jgi:Gram-negative bacterial TonB protein C-terminal
VLSSKLLTVALTAIFAISSSAQDTPEKKTYRLIAEPVIGSNLPQHIVRSAPYPVDRAYAQFTDEEKATLRSQYEGMPESDEPPFPVKGLAPILRDVSKLTGALKAEGELTIFVTVDPSGNATQVALVKYPNAEVANAVAYVLIKAKYKPAMCAGQPCTLDFPFRTKLVLR